MVENRERLVPANIFFIRQLLGNKYFWSVHKYVVLPVVKVIEEFFKENVKRANLCFNRFEECSEDPRAKGTLVKSTT